MPAPAYDPLRPKTLAEFSGQPELASQLSWIIGAAQRRGELPEHLLFYGPPGLGKTTLANITAAELDAELVSVTGPSLERPGDLAAILTDVDDGTVVFIDEIHRLPTPVEEQLYPAMEDRTIDLVVGDGPAKQVINLPLGAFTLVGATTEFGKLSKPLRDRFGYTGRLRPYDIDTLTQIVLRSAALLELTVTEPAACLLAERSRGTPRVANHRLRLVRDWAAMHDIEQLDCDQMEAGLTAFEIDQLGLDPAAREVLTVLCDAAAPLGLSHLATVVGEAASTIEQHLEPQLLSYGLIARTSRGRLATPAGFSHLGLQAADTIPPATATPTAIRPDATGPGEDIALPFET